METSAKSSTNVTELFVAIAKKLPKTEAPVVADQSNLTLQSAVADSDEKKKKKCC